MSIRRRPKIAPDHPGLSVEAVFAGLVPAGAILAIAVACMHRARRQNDRTATHDFAAHQLAAYQLVDVRRAERAALARDLHDDVAPILFGIETDAALLRHELGRGKSQEAADRAQAIEDRVRRLQTHIRRELARLAPHSLETRGLAGALERLVADWRRQIPGCDVILRVEGPPPRPPLDEIAFRIVQESLSNAMRHGAPSAVEVLVETATGQVRLVVADDGSGFPDGKVVPGFGLTGMETRVRAAGGHLSVGNREGRRGAMVEALLPLAGASGMVGRRADVAA